MDIQTSKTQKLYVCWVYTQGMVWVKPKTCTFYWLILSALRITGLYTIHIDFTNHQFGIDKIIFEKNDFTTLFVNRMIH